MSEWEVVIGMEVHVQPRTRTKMFCGCAVGQLGDPPNSNVCEICLGLPGTLPVANKTAVEACLRTALALNCKIPRHTKWDRKNYMYPDLPKGYQISQYDLPMSHDGFLELNGHKVRIRRVHLEEDTGKLIHAGDKLQRAWESYVDLNRAGVPLMEIVSEPDLRSAEEARDYAMELRTLLRTIGVSEADMEKGQMRAEPNISIRRAGSQEFGVKTESSVDAVIRAARQSQQIADGGIHEPHSKRQGHVRSKLALGPDGAGPGEHAVGPRRSAPETQVPAPALAVGRRLHFRKEENALQVFLLEVDPPVLELEVRRRDVRMRSGECGVRSFRMEKRSDVPAPRGASRPSITAAGC